MRSAVTALVAVGLATRLGLSADEAVDLEWEAPPGVSCPPVTEIVRSLDHVAALAKSGEPIHARVVITKTRTGRLRLDLTTTRGTTTGHRTLEQDSCRALASATVVILAWIVDPSGGGADASSAPSASTPPGASVSEPIPAPGSASAVASAAPTVVPESDPPSPKAPPARSARTRFALGLDLAVDAGTLPSVALGPRVDLAIASGRARFGLYAAYFPHSAQATPTSQFPNAGGSFSLLAGGAEGCFLALPTGAVQATICGGAELDRGRGAAFGVPLARVGSSTWTALAGSGELLVPTGFGFAFAARAGVVAPLRRREFVIDDLGDVHTAAAIAARASLGARVAFW